MIIRADTSGALCGYVGVGPLHPAYCIATSGEPEADAAARRQDFRDRLSRWNRKGIETLASSELPNETPVPGIGEQVVNINCHGGLTFAGRMRPAEQSKKSDMDVWWFGFDCSHAWDISPAIDAVMRSIRSRNFAVIAKDQTYRDIDYVKKEVTQLAAQLAALVVEVPATLFTTRE